jgi:hypothetical protein
MLTDAQRATLAEIRKSDDYSQDVSNPEAEYDNQYNAKPIIYNYRNAAGELVCTRIGTSGRQLAPRFSV